MAGWSRRRATLASLRTTVLDRILHRLSLLRFVHGRCLPLLLHRLCLPAIVHRRATLMCSCEVLGYTGFLQTESFNLARQSRRLGSLTSMSFRQPYRNALLSDLHGCCRHSAVHRAGCCKPLRGDRRRWNKMSTTPTPASVCPGSHCRRRRLLNTARASRENRPNVVSLRFLANPSSVPPLLAPAIAYPSFLFPHFPQHFLQLLLLSPKLALLIDSRRAPAVV